MQFNVSAKLLYIHVIRQFFSSKVMKVTQAKKQKILSLGCKPIKLKFENMKDNIEDKNGEDALTCSRVSVKDKDKDKEKQKQKDNLMRLEKCLDEAIACKIGLSQEIIEKCIQLTRTVKKHLDNQFRGSSKMKFRIVKSAKKLAATVNHSKTDQSFQQFYIDATSPINSLDHKQSALPELKTSASQSQCQSQASPIFTKIKLKKNIQGKITQMCTNNSQLHNKIHNENISPITEVKHLVSDEVIKKMKLQIKKLMNERDEKVVVIQNLVLKVQEMNKNMAVESGRNEEIRALLEEKDYEIERQKSNCRLLEAELEKIRLKSLDNKPINLVFDIEFSLKVLEQQKTTSTPKQQPSTNYAEKHLEQITNHLQLIIVSQSQQIDNLHRKWSQIQKFGRGK